MKWTIVLVACLVAVGANLEEEDHKEVKNALPILRIKQLGENAATVPTPEKESNSSEDTDLTAESSQEAEQNSDNDLKRVKKSPGLTTICVEIKPTSPYEPPYFMCRGTDSEHGSYGGGGYKPSSYGGKPSSGKGGGYGYEKPYGGSSYGSHEEYLPPSPGYSKPRPDKYNHGGGYDKPSGGSGGTYGGINAYGRPIKYQTPHSNSYSSPKPSAPYGGYGGGGGGYEAHAPAGYGKPPTHYAPHHGKPYGGEGYNSGPSYQPASHGGGAYGGPASHGAHGGGYSSGGSYGHGAAPGAGYGPAGSYGHGPAYKGGGKPAGYDYGKPVDKYSGGKGSGGHSAPAGGYRTIIMDGDDDEEINEVEDHRTGPQVGMPVSYNYHPPAAQVHSYHSPAPKVPCGTNLLVGCNPSVQHVPCYGSHAPAAPSIVYNIQPAPPAVYAPPAAPAYKPAAPAYGYQRTNTDEMQPKLEDPQNVEQKNPQAIQNIQTRTQADGMPKTTDAEMRLQQGNIDTTSKQDTMKDDKMRQNTDGMQMPKGPVKDTKHPTSTQFKHPGVLRQDDTTGKMSLGTQDMSMNMADAARQQGEVGEMKKLSDADDAERKKNEAMMRMQQMQQMAQNMGGGKQRMDDGTNPNVAYGW